MYYKMSSQMTNVERIHYWVDAAITFVSLSLPLLMVRSRVPLQLGGYFPFAIFLIEIVIYMIGLAGTIQLIRYRSWLSLVAIIWIIIQIFGLSPAYQALGYRGYSVLTATIFAVIFTMGVVIGGFLPAVVGWKWRRNRWYAVSLVPGIFILAAMLTYSASWRDWLLMG